MANKEQEMDGLQAARRRAAEQMAEEARLASRRADSAEERAAYALLEMDLRGIAMRFGAVDSDQEVLTS